MPVLKGTVPHEQSAKVWWRWKYSSNLLLTVLVLLLVVQCVPYWKVLVITDVLAKSKGSSNPHNLVKATILALGEMRDARMVAQNRGISIEKVFRG